MFFGLCFSQVLFLNVDNSGGVVWGVFYGPATKWRGAYSFTLVTTYVRPSVTHFSTVLVSPAPHTVFDAGI